MSNKSDGGVVEVPVSEIINVVKNPWPALEHIKGSFDVASLVEREILVSSEAFGQKVILEEGTHSNNVSWHVSGTYNPPKVLGEDLDDIGFTGLFSVGVDNIYQPHQPFSVVGDGGKLVVTKEHNKVVGVVLCGDSDTKYTDHPTHHTYIIPAEALTQ